MYGSMEESTPAAEAPALGPAEVKFVRKLMAIDDILDFGPICSSGHPLTCGNTCCVPSSNGTNGTVQAVNRCNGTNAEADRILKCIKRFSADEWKGCTHDEKFDCGCGNDEEINYCCGSADQAEAIEIWSQCLAVE